MENAQTGIGLKTLRTFILSKTDSTKQKSCRCVLLGIIKKTIGLDHPNTIAIAHYLLE